MLSSSSTLCKCYHFYTGFGDHCFFICKNDKLWAFGRNESGQLSLGTKCSYVSKPEIVDIFLGGNMQIVDISLGVFHTLIQTKKQGAFSCGMNDDGRTSCGSSSNWIGIANRVLLKNGRSVEKVSAGYYTSFFISTDEFVYSHGSRLHGRLCRPIQSHASSSSWRSERAGKVRLGPSDEKCSIVKGSRDWVCFLTKSGNLFMGGRFDGLEIDAAVPLKLDIDVKKFKRMEVVSPNAIHFFTSENSVFALGACSIYDVEEHVPKTQVVQVLENVPDIISFSGGDDFVVYVTQFGVYSCGRNFEGALGKHAHPSRPDGTVPSGKLTRTKSPLEIAALKGKGVCQVAATPNCTFYLTDSGEIFAAGKSHNGLMMRSGAKKVFQGPECIGERKFKVNEYSYFNRRAMEKEMQERLQFVLQSLPTETTVKFTYRSIGLYKTLLLSTDLYEKVDEEGNIVLNNCELMGDENVDGELLMRILFGCDSVCTELFKLGPRYYFQLWRLFNLLGLKKHELFILDQIKEIEDITTLVKLFLLSFRKLENVETKHVDLYDDSDCFLDKSRKLEFQGTINLLLFNIIKNRYSEIQNTPIVRVFERLGCLTNLLQHQPVPIDQLPCFENVETQRSLRELYLSHLHELYARRRETGNFIVVTNDEKEIYVHKEVVVAESDYFYRCVKFSGRETRREGYLLLERVDLEELSILVEFLYLKKVSIEAEALVPALRILMEIFPYAEKPFMRELIKNVVEITKTQLLEGSFIDEVLPSIGVFFHEHAVTYPENLKKFLLEEWGEVEEKDNILRGIERSFYTHKIRKLEKENEELKSTLSSLQGEKGSEKKKKRKRKAEDDSDYVEKDKDGAEKKKKYRKIE